MIKLKQLLESTNSEKYRYSWQLPSGKFSPVQYSHGTHAFKILSILNPGWDPKNDHIMELWKKGYNRIVNSGNTLLVHNEIKPPSDKQKKALIDLAIECNDEYVEYDSGNNSKILWSIHDLLTEIMDVPPQEPKTQMVQSHNKKFRVEFLNYIKLVENGKKVGFRDGIWYPHKSPEGGNATIGYGHKIKSSETNLLNGGTNVEIEKILVEDLEKARKIVYSDIKEMFNVNIVLDPMREEMLVDFAFNLGSLKKFPNFTKSVLNKDWDMAKKEYKRSYSNGAGRVELKNRNDMFYKMFLDNPPK